MDAWYAIHPKLVEEKSVSMQNSWVYANEKAVVGYLNVCLKGSVWASADVWYNFGDSAYRLHAAVTGEMMFSW